MKAAATEQKAQAKRNASEEQGQRKGISPKTMGLAEKMVRHYKVAGRLRSFGSYNH